MSVFEPVKMRSLEHHYKELLPIVRSHFRHVTKPFVDIPRFTDTYLTWRSYIRRLKGEENISVHTRIRDEYVKKYSKYNFPEYILGALVDYSVYRYFIQTPELRPPIHMDLADDVINPVQRNKELLLGEFVAELERKKVIARTSASKVLRSYDIDHLKSSNPFKSNRVSRLTSEFLVGKKKRTQKKRKGKRRRRSKTGKMRR